ncbi:hypothetical protein HAX54_012494, partial [Datura stramonium]|nr:hypothetical protein [Datura stramonium]
TIDLRHGTLAPPAARGSLTIPAQQPAKRGSKASTRPGSTRAFLLHVGRHDAGQFCALVGATRHGRPLLCFERRHKVFQTAQKQISYFS